MLQSPGRQTAADLGTDVAKPSATLTRNENVGAVDEVRLIAFYLPQFHPIPENDEWWGKGFTEWTNVVRARPNYEGHEQPRIPADLGTYDLRDPDVMPRQAELASRFGIHGFCYYYYWFGGKRLLEMPLERLLQTGKPDFPFCLCWANESWTRRWDGAASNVLMQQRHSDEDDRAVIRDLARYLRHPRYIRVDGRPLLLVYRISLFPDFRLTARTWREHCRREGIGEIHLSAVESHEMCDTRRDPGELGLDSTVEFPPHGTYYSRPHRRKLLNPEFRGSILGYRDVAVAYSRKTSPGHVRFKTVMPGFDNTARRQNEPSIFELSHPLLYQVWLEQAIRVTRQLQPGGASVVFINAWNEWAEGNYLEPDQRFGYRYLEATRDALRLAVPAPSP